MKRLLPFIFVVLPIVAASVGRADEADTWPFAPKPDAFTADAPLDLRSLNEEKSGETGFVRLSKDGDSFVRGDGRPVRFWAIGSSLYRSTPENMDRHCRFLAKLGVNMVRLHTTVANTSEGAAITDVNEKEIDGIFRFIKAAKDSGIYITLSPYYGHHKTPKSWGLEGYDGVEPWGAIFVDPKMQDAYKAWTKALYARENPYTGLAIKDDPTVAIIQVHNEDSMLFWTMQRLPKPQMKRLGAHFAAWLTRKHGSLDKALRAWDGQKHEDDDFEHDIIGLLSTWHMTRDWQGGTSKRLRDQTQFIAEFQRQFYADMGAYLRQTLGCKQLLNATNWRTANDLKLKEIERWTYAALDMDAENEYYGSDYQHRGENANYRIDPGHHFVNESCLHKPLELTTNFKQQVGHPFLVTETSWKNPNLYQTEGAFLIAAYQSLGGVDAVYWFNADEPMWNLDPRKNFWRVGESFAYHKWSCSTPTLLGAFPANALLFRKGYVKEGDVVVHESRSLEDLWQRKAPIIDDNEIYGVSRETDECKAMRRPDGRISRAAFLVGRVTMELGGDPAKTRISDFSRHLDAEKRLIRSNTGELTWNYGAGWCTMNAPKAQGVTGFLKAAGGRFALRDVTIESQNEYAAINLVAMDDKPLAASRRILVQVGTTARLEGWRDKPVEFEFQEQKISGSEIVHTGRPPWRIVNTHVTLTVRNPHLSKLTVLDESGYARRTIELTRRDGAAVVELPADTMYAVLE